MDSRQNVNPMQSKMAYNLVSSNIDGMVPQNTPARVVDTTNNVKIMFDVVNEKNKKAQYNYAPDLSKYYF